MKNFKELELPKTLKVSSSGNNMRPLTFFGKVIPVSNKIQFKLGYFSTNSIKTLSYGFAQFIFNGGKIDFLINHFVSDNDYKFLNSEVNEDPELYEKIEKEILKDIDKLYEVLSKKEINHFYNCLRYLKDNNRINFFPVTTKDGSVSHYKEALFWDNLGNIININGSCNFTYNGIVENGESITISRSWGSTAERENIKNEVDEYKTIFEKSSKDFIYLNPESLINIINEKSISKEIKDLLEDEKNLIEEGKNTKELKDIMKELNSEFEKFSSYVQKSPKFPYKSPHNYQIEANKNWIENGHKGLFAMATGTGKTLTAINCMVEDFKMTGQQKNIIVVPGKELVEQWFEEMKSANFITPIKWYSNNTKLSKDIKYLKLILSSPKPDEINIIITYASFKSSKFLNLFSTHLKDFIVVFDEAHNMAAPGVRSAICSQNFEKRIGLSATPLRLWDENDENKFIEEFFDAFPPYYTFYYSMEEAIKNGYLCKYKYHPHFVHFTDEEWEIYLSLTTKIFIQLEQDSGNMSAALKRQLLKDQAENKGSAVVEIIDKLLRNNSVKNTLVYCPKGTNEEETKYIDELYNSIAARFPNLNIDTFIGETQNRGLLLKDFEEERIDMLLAIKCLDEGVNIPKTMNAIFVASGQNYREFVQRRGRVLRTYKKNGFVKEHANLYDVVVLPTTEQYFRNKNTALNLIISEFGRLYEFYSLAIPEIEVYNKISLELEDFGLTEEYIRNKVNKKKTENE